MPVHSTHYVLYSSLQRIQKQILCLKPFTQQWDCGCLRSSGILRGVGWQISVPFLSATIGPKCR